MGAKTSGNSPCASCKLLRRRCAKDCVFAPYFPPDEPHKFASVHKVFGASNVSKMLQELPVHQRGDAVKSMVYEANARMRDPVYGCVGAISYLQQQVAQLQMQLAMAQAEILCMHMRHHEALKNYNSTSDFMDHKQQQHHQIATIPLQQQQQMMGSSQSLPKPPLSHHPQPSDCSATTSAYSMDEQQQQHPHHHLATDSTTVDHFIDARAASDSLWS